MNKVKKILTGTVISAMCITSFGCAGNSLINKNADAKFFTNQSLNKNISTAKSSNEIDNKIGKIVETNSIVIPFNYSNKLANETNLNSQNSSGSSLIKSTDTNQNESVSTNDSDFDRENLSIFNSNIFNFDIEDSLINSINNDYDLFVFSNIPFMQLSENGDGNNFSMSVKFISTNYSNGGEQINSKKKMSDEEYSEYQKKLKTYNIKKSILMVYLGEIYNGNVNLTENNKLEIANQLKNINPSIETNTISDNKNSVNNATTSKSDTLNSNQNAETTTNLMENLDNNSLSRQTNNTNTNKNSTFTNSKTSNISSQVTSSNNFKANNHNYHYMYLTNGKMYSSEYKNIDAKISAINSIIEIIEDNLVSSSSFYNLKLNGNYTDFINNHSENSNISINENSSNQEIASAIMCLIDSSCCKPKMMDAKKNNLLNSRHNQTAKSTNNSLSYNENNNKQIIKNQDIAINNSDDKSLNEIVDRNKSNSHRTKDIQDSDLLNNNLTTSQNTQTIQNSRTNGNNQTISSSRNQQTSQSSATNRNSATNQNYQNIYNTTTRDNSIKYPSQDIQDGQNTRMNQTNSSRRARENRRYFNNTTSSRNNNSTINSNTNSSQNTRNTNINSRTNTNTNTKSNINRNRNNYNSERTELARPRSIDEAMSNSQNSEINNDINNKATDISQTPRTLELSHRDYSNSNSINNTPTAMRVPYRTNSQMQIK